MSQNAATLPRESASQNRVHHTNAQVIKIASWLSNNRSKVEGLKSEDASAVVTKATGIQCPPRHVKRYCREVGIPLARTQWGALKSRRDRIHVAILTQAVDAVYASLGIKRSPAFAKLVEFCETAKLSDQNPDGEPEDREE